MWHMLRKIGACRVESGTSCVELAHVGLNLAHYA